MTTDSVDFVHLMANALQSAVCDVLAGEAHQARALELLRRAESVNEPAASLCVAMLLSVATKTKTIWVLEESWTRQWTEALGGREFLRAATLLELAFALHRREDPLLAAVRAHVLRHHSNPHLTIAGTAETLGVQRRKMASALSKAGTSYRQLLRVARVEAALARMVNERQSVKEAAYAVGYRYPTEFTRDCRTLRGHSPRDAVQARIET